MSIVPRVAAPRPIDPGVRIGHVHLRTADIDRVRAFYVDVLSFDVVSEARDVPGWGTTGDLLFVSPGGYHHHVAVNVWNGKGATAPAPHTAGLRHWTVELPSASDVEALRARVLAGGHPLKDAEAGLLTRDPFGTAVTFVAAEASR